MIQNDDGVLLVRSLVLRFCSILLLLQLLVNDISFDLLKLVLHIIVVLKRVIPVYTSCVAVAPAFVWISLTRQVQVSIVVRILVCSSVEFLSSFLERAALDACSRGAHKK